MNALAGLVGLLCLAAIDCRDPGSYMIPGRSCGTLKAIKTVEEKVEDPAKLEPCTIVRDRETVKKIKDATAAFVNGDWSDCSVTCGVGQRTRTRQCRNATDTLEPLVCGSDTTELHLPCDKGSCSVDGMWSAWSPWSNCPSTCCSGGRTRTRTCDNPPPNEAGLYCQGPWREAGDCLDTPCNIAKASCLLPQIGLDHAPNYDMIYLDNPAQCHSRCQQTAGCAGYTYVAHNDNRCYLKDDRYAPTVPQAIFTSGYRVCGCLEIGVDYEGGDFHLGVLDNVPDAESCQHECMQNNDCGAFTHVPADLKCYLKKEKGTVSAIAEVISGPKFCGCPAKLTCMEQNTAYDGPNLDSLVVADANACHAACQTIMGCAGYTFIHSDSTCLRKSALGVASSAAGATSGPRACGCLVDGTSYSGGHDLLPVLPTADAETCQVECQLDDRCMAFTFDVGTSLCYLKYNHEGLVAYAQGISGTKFCH